MKVTLHEEQNTFMTSHSLLRMRNISDKSCREKHILCSTTLFENSAVYQKTWKKYCRDGQATDNTMAHAHCMLNT
jgi:hypothetical protein